MFPTDCNQIETLAFPSRRPPCCCGAGGYLDVPAVAVIEASKFALEVQQDHPNLALLVSHDGNPHVAVAQTIALLRKPYSLAAVAARISALVRELPDRSWIGQEQRQ
jgi:hypothetical protein